MQFINLELFSVVMFFISFFGIITGRNIIKSIVSITLMETSVVMFIISIGFSSGMTPPIGQNLENAADPLPQALMITAIVIGVAVTAVNFTMLISLYRQYKSAEWDIVKNNNLE